MSRVETMDLGLPGFESQVFYSLALLLQMQEKQIHLCLLNWRIFCLLQGDWYQIDLGKSIVLFHGAILAKITCLSYPLRGRQFYCKPMIPYL